MGAEEHVKQASQMAILNANYICRLKNAFPVLYVLARDGRVAHGECILDIRPLKEETGISELDIAKATDRLWFPRPTMSFPVMALMVEPTEIGKQSGAGPFIDAMLAIRGGSTA